jgi:hypothetical protein
MQLFPTAYRHRDICDLNPEQILSGISWSDNETPPAIQHVDLPNNIRDVWSDSMIIYVTCAEDILNTNNIILINSIGKIIRNKEVFLNDYKIPEKDHNIYMNISPATAGAIVETYSLTNVPLLHSDTDIPVDWIYRYIEDWIRLLHWSSRGDYGLFIYVT